MITLSNVKREIRLWVKSLTPFVLVFLILYSGYAITTKLSVLARIILIINPFNHTIVVAPFAITVLLWTSYFTIFYYKQYREYIIPLYLFLFGLSDLNWQLTFAISRGIIPFLTFSVYHVQFFPFPPVFVIVFYFILKNKIKLQNIKIGLLLLLYFDITYIAIGVPIVDDALLKILNHGNWAWELYYNIIILMLISLTIKHELKTHNKTTLK